MVGGRKFIPPDNDDSSGGVETDLTLWTGRNIAALRASIAATVKLPAGWRNANGPSLSRCREISEFNQLTLASSLRFPQPKGEYTMSVNSDFAIAQHPTKPSKALNLTIWGVQILTALAFLAAGGSKLSSAPPMVDMFEKIRLGQWFRNDTGSLEVIGAVLLLLPRTSAIGGWLLAAVMIGAIGTHLLIIGGSPIPAVVLLALAITVGWNRSRR